MAETDIKIKVGADGASEAASQVEKLNASLEKTRKTQEMITKTQSDMKRQVIIDAIKKESAALEELDAKQKKLTNTIQEAASATGGSIETNVGKIRAATGAGAALVGNLGNSFAAIVPQAGQFVGALQSGGMAMGQFLGVLGGGTGLVVGGLVAAIGLLAKYFGEAATEGDKLAKTVDTNADAAGGYLAQLNKIRGNVRQRNQAQTDEDTRQKQLNRGTASYGMYEEEFGAVQGMLDARKAEFKSRAEASGLNDADQRKALRVMVANDPEIAKLNQRLSRLEQGRQSAAGTRTAEELNAKDKGELERAIALAAGSGVRGRTFDYSQMREPKKKPIPNLADQYGNDFMMEQQDSFAELQKSRQETELASVEGTAKREQEMKLEAMKTGNSIQLQEEEQFRQRMDDVGNDFMQKELDGIDQRVDAHKQATAAITQAERASAQMITGSVLKGVSEVIKGKKLEAGAILEGLGDQFVAAGTGLIFQGLGLSANPLTPGAGAGMVAVGTAEVAFGLGLGAAGARMPGGSNAGGNPGPGGYQATTPYRDSFSPSDRDSGPTIININMPTVVSPSPEDGVRIQQALDAKLRVYGK